MSTSTFVTSSQIPDETDQKHSLNTSKTAERDTRLRLSDSEDDLQNESQPSSPSQGPSSPPNNISDTSESPTTNPPHSLEWNILFEATLPRPESLPEQAEDFENMDDDDEIEEQCSKDEMNRGRLKSYNKHIMAEKDEVNRVHLESLNKQAEKSKKKEEDAALTVHQRELDEFLDSLDACSTEENDKQLVETSATDVISGETRNISKISLTDSTEVEKGAVGSQLFYRSLGSFKDGASMGENSGDQVLTDKRTAEIATPASKVTSEELPSAKLAASANTMEQIPPANITEHVSVENVMEPEHIPQGNIIEQIPTAEMLENISTANISADVGNESSGQSLSQVIREAMDDRTPLQDSQRRGVEDFSKSNQFGESFSFSQASIDTNKINVHENISPSIPTESSDLPKSTQAAVISTSTSLTFETHHSIFGPKRPQATRRRKQKTPRQVRKRKLKAQADFSAETNFSFERPSRRCPPQISNPHSEGACSGYSGKFEVTTEEGVVYKGEVSPETGTVQDCCKTEDILTSAEYAQKYRKNVPERQDRPEKKPTPRSDRLLLHKPDRHFRQSQSRSDTKTNLKKPVPSLQHSGLSAPGNTSDKLHPKDSCTTPTATCTIGASSVSPLPSYAQSRMCLQSKAQGSETASLQTARTVTTSNLQNDEAALFANKPFNILLKSQVKKESLKATLLNELQSDETKKHPSCVENHPLLQVKRKTATCSNTNNPNTLPTKRRGAVNEEIPKSGTSSVRFEQSKVSPSSVHPHDAVQENKNSSSVSEKLDLPRGQSKEAVQHIPGHSLATTTCSEFKTGADTISVAFAAKSVSSDSQTIVTNLKVPKRIAPKIKAQESAVKTGKEPLELRIKSIVPTSSLEENQLGLPRPERLTSIMEDTMSLAEQRGTYRQPAKFKDTFPSKKPKARFPVLTSRLNAATSQHEFGKSVQPTSSKSTDKASEVPQCGVVTLSVIAAKAPQRSNSTSAAMPTAVNISSESSECKPACKTSISTVVNQPSLVSIPYFPMFAPGAIATLLPITSQTQVQTRPQLTTGVGTVQSQAQTPQLFPVVSKLSFILQAPMVLPGTLNTSTSTQTVGVAGNSSSALQPVILTNNYQVISSLLQAGVEHTDNSSSSLSPATKSDKQQKRATSGNKDCSQELQAGKSTPQKDAVPKSDAENKATAVKECGGLAKPSNGGSSAGKPSQKILVSKPPESSTSQHLSLAAGNAGQTTAQHLSLAAGHTGQTTVVHTLSSVPIVQAVQTAHQSNVQYIIPHNNVNLLQAVQSTDQTNSMPFLIFLPHGFSASVPQGYPVSTSTTYTTPTFTTTTAATSLPTTTLTTASKGPTVSQNISSLSTASVSNASGLKADSQGGNEQVKSSLAVLANQKESSLESSRKRRRSSSQTNRPSKRRKTKASTTVVTQASLETEREPDVTGKSVDSVGTQTTKVSRDDSSCHQTKPRPAHSRGLKLLDPRKSKNMLDPFSKSPMADSSRESAAKQSVNPTLAARPYKLQGVDPTRVAGPSRLQEAVGVSPKRAVELMEESAKTTPTKNTLVKAAQFDPRTKSKTGKGSRVKVQSPKVSRLQVVQTPIVARDSNQGFTRDILKVTTDDPAISSEQPRGEGSSKDSNHEAVEEDSNKTLTLPPQPDPKQVIQQPDSQASTFKLTPAAEVLQETAGTLPAGNVPSGHLPPKRRRLASSRYKFAVNPDYISGDSDVRDITPATSDEEWTPEKNNEEGECISSDEELRRSRQNRSADSFDALFLPAKRKLGSKQYCYQASIKGNPTQNKAEASTSTQNKPNDTPFSKSTNIAGYVPSSHKTCQRVTEIFPTTSLVLYPASSTIHRGFNRTSESTHLLSTRPQTVQAGGETPSGFQQSREHSQVDRCGSTALFPNDSAVKDGKESRSQGKVNSSASGSTSVGSEGKDEATKERRGCGDDGEEETNTTVKKRRRRRGKNYTQDELTCKTCHKIFVNIYRLRRHQFSHGDLRPFACDICHKSFKQAGHRNEHRLTHCIKKRSFLCNVCGVVIASRSSFRYHLQHHHMHMQVQPGMISTSLYEIHPADSDDDDNETLVQSGFARSCQQAIETMTSRERNQPKKNQGDPGKTKRNQEDSNESSSTEPPSDKERHTDCRSSRGDKRNARMGGTQRTGGGRFRLSDKRRRQADQAVALAASFQTLAAQELLAAYDCPHCSERFGTAQSLNCHLETHVEIEGRCHVQPYTCKDCGRSFTYRHNLDKHLNGHGKQQAERRAVSYQRKVQDAIAQGQPHYDCETCGKAFLRKETLVKHTRTHLGVRPHRCPYCPKDFTQKIHLTVHCRLHTGSRPFKCKCCHCCFLDSTALARHVERGVCLKEGFNYSVGKRGRKPSWHRTDTDGEVAHSAKKKKETLSDKPLSCGICGWRGKKVGFLVRHLALCHSDHGAKNKVVRRSETVTKAQQKDVKGDDDSPEPSTSKDQQDTIARCSDQQDTMAKPTRCTDQQDTMAKPARCADQQDTMAKPSRCTDQQDTIAKPARCTDQQDTMAKPARCTDQQDTMAKPARCTDQQDTIAKPARCTDQQDTIAKPARCTDQQDTIAKPARCTDQQDTIAKPARCTDQQGTIAKPARCTDQQDTIAKPARCTDQQDTIAKPARCTDQQDTIAKPARCTDQQDTMAKPSRCTDQQDTMAKPARCADQQDTMAKPSRCADQQDTMAKPARCTDQQDTIAKPSRCTDQQDTIAKPARCTDQQDTIAKPARCTDQQDTMAKPSRCTDQQDTMAKPARCTDHQDTVQEPPTCTDKLSMSLSPPIDPAD